MRRFMGLLLAILLMLQPIQLEAAGFRDVAANDWYYENISRLVHLGGFSGYPSWRRPALETLQQTTGIMKIYQGLSALEASADTLTVPLSPLRP